MKIAQETDSKLCCWDQPAPGQPRRVWQETSRQQLGRRDGDAGPVRHRDKDFEIIAQIEPLERIATP